MIRRIHCGDSLDLMRDMEDKSIDLVVTDPPFGIKNDARKANTRESTPVKQRNGTYLEIPKPTYELLEWDNKIPSQEYFDEIFRVSKNQIIFGGNYFPLSPSPCWIVWDKRNGSCDFADCELAWTSFKSAVRIFRYKWNGMLQEDMAHKERRIHPAQKPLKLMEWCLQNYSEPGDIVLDPFMGSGTTIEACIRTGRQYIGIDIYPQYCEMAQARVDRANNSKLTDFEKLPVTTED